MKKKITKRPGRHKKSPRYSCTVCGLVVTVDETCGCVDTCDIICCGENMEPKK